MEYKKTEVGEKTTLNVTLNSKIVKITNKITNSKVNP